MRLRVVCGLLDTIAIFCPRRRLRIELLPTFGLPTIAILIVLSSSWRSYDLASTIEEYKDTAFKPIIDNLVGVTPGTMSRNRGEEINRFFDIVNGNITQNLPQAIEWLKQHPLETLSATGEKIEQYVIFDDDTDITDKQKSHFVHIDFWNGIQEKDYKKAKQILLTK